MAYLASVKAEISEKDWGRIRFKCGDLGIEDLEVNDIWIQDGKTWIRIFVRDLDALDPVKEHEAFWELTLYLLLVGGGKEDSVEIYRDDEITWLA